MSSTLYFRRTPKVKEIGHCKLPLKAAFARRFYDHDGTLGGEEITIDSTQLEWLRGVLDGGNYDVGEEKLLEKIISLLEDGETVDMWFEV